MASYTFKYLESGSEGITDCQSCRFGWGTDLPIPKELSIEGIVSQAEKFSRGIIADWTALNAIIKRFEPTIQKRWLRKGSKQRCDVLIEAWPEMPRSHRPDFMGIREGKKIKAFMPSRRKSSEAAYLWPYINLEDLQDSHLLLLFVNSRARNLPEMFVHADLKAAHLGHGWDCEGQKQDGPEEEMSMLFHAQRSPRTYGRVVPLTLASHMQAVFPWKPSAGLLALEIQQGIYSFLLKCAKLILHDIDPKQYRLAPHEPAPDLPRKISNKWPSLTATMIETPYLVPQRMDVDRLKTLVGARKAAAEDHLWMLREDPGYFVETMKDWKEHDSDLLRHACGDCTQHLAEHMIQDAFSTFLHWDVIHNHLESLPLMESQMERADHCKVRLAEKDELAWASILGTVESMLHLPVCNLRYGIPPSPRMRHCYNWEMKDPEAGRNIWASKRKFKREEHRVNLLFQAIVTAKQHQLHPMHSLVQEVQYMLETDPEASELVDSWIVGHFSDLALLTELQWRIEAMQPWEKIWQRAQLEEGDDIELAMSELSSLNKRLQDGIRAACRGTPILNGQYEQDFEYPAAKAITEANVRKMRNAECCLDMMWFRIENLAKIESGTSITQTMWDRLTTPRQLHRTPEWVPPLILSNSTPTLVEVDANASCHRQATTRMNEEVPKAPKDKVKTRGATIIPAIEEIAQVEAQQQAPGDDLPKIQIPRRAYKALAVLLPNATAEGHQRVGITWDEFLQAMNIIGLQPEKVHGNVWLLKPEPKDCLVELNRSIQFYEPKEVRRGSKISANMARAFGRRLKHAYGWESEMFVCE